MQFGDEFMSNSWCAESFVAKRKLYARAETETAIVLASRK
jgi:hypothetical protein